MLVFEHIVKDELGLHARPASMLVKFAKEINTTIRIRKDHRTAEATKLVAIMSLGIKQGEHIIVEVEGREECKDIALIKTFFEENV